MEFKDKIKKRRIELKLTLEEVAKRVGVSTPTIQRYESGEIKNVRRDKIKRLSDTLQVSPSYLMDWEEAAGYISDKGNALIDEIPLSKTEKEFLIMARHAENIPEEEKEKLKTTIADTIELYLSRINKK